MRGLCKLLVKFLELPLIYFTDVFVFIREFVMTMFFLLLLLHTIPKVVFSEPILAHTHLFHLLVLLSSASDCADFVPLSPLSTWDDLRVLI
jgi:hypothetical protein